MYQKIVDAKIEKQKTSERYQSLDHYLSYQHLYQMVR